ncbi:MAG: YggS family pyridoxal phosphate-dependent enzyme [Coprobacillus sp.]
MMKVNKETVKTILDEIKPRTLIAATKYVDEKAIEELESCGCLYYGENRVQAFLEKYEKYHGKGHWHFIGTLQRNKVKYIIDKVELIHSVNSYELIDEIEKQAGKNNIHIHVLLQVNIANEKSKHGFQKEEMNQVMEYIQSCSHIIVDGLMMMAPNIEIEQTRTYFHQTKELLEELNKIYPMQELSMGMSHDYKIALEEGATLLRIGSALFEEDKPL